MTSADVRDMNYHCQVKTVQILRHRANDKTIEKDAVTSIVLSSGKEIKSSNLQALGLMFEIGNIVSPPIDQLELGGVVMPDVARITQGGDSYRTLQLVSLRADYRDKAVWRLPNLVLFIDSAPCEGLLEPEIECLTPQQRTLIRFMLPKKHFVNVSTIKEHSKAFRNGVETQNRSVASQFVQVSKAWGRLPSVWTVTSRDNRDNPSYKVDRD